MQIKSRYVVALSLLFLTVLSISLLKMNSKTLKIVLVVPPTSADPLDYDTSVHHNTMRPVFASLVSEYKKGQLSPQIASKWSATEDKTVWTLNIDPSWTFENGELITPEIVVQSFKRVLYIKNKTNSKSGLLEHLIEADKLFKIDSDIKGLQIVDRKVVFSFNKPLPDFLEKVSFGLYGIAYPKDYDSEGNWINKKKAIASGFYKIKYWDKEKFSLELRQELKSDQLSSKNIQNVDFIFPDDMSDIQGAGVIFSDRISNKLKSEEWEFASSTLNNKIMYVQLMNWDNKESIFYSKHNRQLLRDIYYSNLEKSGMKPMTSFFPLKLNGVSEFKYSLPTRFNANNEIIRTQPFFTTNYKKENIKKAQADIFAEAYYGFCNDINAQTQINQYPERYEDEKNVFDLQYQGTGISINSPKDDIKFMFQSKHGIMLPDESGKIFKLLDTNFDIQQINEELWDQAIIWPVRHYSSGFWYKKELGLDLSDLNIMLTPIDLQYLKWQ